MTYRTAGVNDIPGMQRVRNSVKENVLSDPGLVKDADYEAIISGNGRGWVCLDGTLVTGFAIADPDRENIWALFVDPAYEGRGIGKALHDRMLDWYFLQGKEMAWLSTSPGTRAESFYRRAGWKQCGRHGKELRFEMTPGDWKISAPYRS